MLKKILIVLAVIAVAFVVAVNILSQKAPDLLRASLEKALDKKVKIRSIEYRFPGTFDLDGVQIQEKEDPFVGEDSFSVDHLTLKVSPLSFSKKALVIDRLEVQDASITIRLRHGRLFHPLSSARRSKAAARETSGSGAASPSGVSLPLQIRLFHLKSGHFKFIDYDVEAGGFVIELEDIGAMVRNIALPVSEHKTSYEIRAVVLQGRDQKPADVAISGWTAFGSWDTDASLRLGGVSLPYFKPYYFQITQSLIQEGFVGSQAVINIQARHLVANVGFEITGLLFGSYEAGNELFGLKADEILSFLKDSSGRLKFQFVVDWDMADRSVKLKDVMRKSIEASLKKTVVGNVGKILETAIQRIGEQGLPESKQDVESTVKKIKDLFKI